MTPKEFREFYKAIVGLYGVLDTEAAFFILHQYRPDVKKDDYIKDLFTHLGKKTKGFSFWETGQDGVFLIVDSKFKVSDLDRIFEIRNIKCMNLPFFTPDAYDDFIKYADRTYRTSEFTQAISSYYSKNNEKEMDLDYSFFANFILSFFEQMPFYADTDVKQLFITALENSEYTGVNTEELYKFCVEEYSKVRLRELNGFTSEEWNRLNKNNRKSKRNESYIKEDKETIFTFNDSTDSNEEKEVILKNLRLLLDNDQNKGNFC